MVIDSPFLLLLLAVFIVILFHYLFFLQKILRGLRSLGANENEKIPFEFISVIIPFRNESKNIVANLKSIESQLYPEDRFEVIYVNDSSEDDSLQILKRNIKRSNVRFISVPNEFSKNAHKKRAIRFGIETAKGDIIVTTDADCTHNSEWLMSLLQTFDPVTGFVSGPVEFDTGKNIFSKFQNLEFSGLVLCGAGLIGSGHPTICNAANIAYKKKAFDEVGGFNDQMNLSSGDDELLMQKIFRDSDYKVKFCIDTKSIVRTAANRTISDFYNQRKRWASKGLFYADKNLVLKLILIYSFYLGLVTQLLLGLIVDNIFILSLFISLLLKIIYEFRILSKGKKILFHNLRLSYLVIAEVFQVPYIIFTGLFGAFGNYIWKSRKVNR